LIINKVNGNLPLKWERDMKRIATFLIVSGLVVVGQLSSAQDRLRLGQPNYGGTGCPAGTASVTLSDDQQSMSILFDNFVTEAGGNTGRVMDRKTCGVAIPVHVPQGYSVSIFQVDYRGYNLVPQGGSAQFTAEYFWAGVRGPVSRRTFYGPFDSNYTVTDKLLATALIWSKCGQQVVLRSNPSMVIRTNARRDTAMGTVDSADISSAVVYHLQWKRCN
jgi:hypothetical protein